MAEYGHMLIHGEGGLRQSSLGGLAYLTMGAQLGDSDALQWPATLFREERVVERDEVEARRLYAVSVPQGNWSG